MIDTAGLPIIFKPRAFNKLIGLSTQEDTNLNDGDYAPNMCDLSFVR